MVPVPHSELGAAVNCRAPEHETRNCRNRLRGTGHGHVPGRDGQRRDVRRLRRGEDRAARAGRGADLRTGPGGADFAERGRRAAALHHRPGGRRRGCQDRLPGRGHAAGRRWLGRSYGPLGGRGRSGPASAEGGDRGAEEHGAGGHQRRGHRPARPADGPWTGVPGAPAWPTTPSSSRKGRPSTTS